LAPVDARAHLIPPVPQPGSKSRPRRWLTSLIHLLGRMPLPVLYGISSVLFVLLYYVLRMQRKLVLDNIRGALPELAPGLQKRIAARSYRNTLDVLLETIKAQTLTPRQLADRVVIENPQLIYDLLKDHPTVVAAAAHQGNWEWMQLACAAQLDIRIATLYKPISHTDLDAQLQALRRRFGTTLIAAGGSLGGLARFTQAGGVVAVLADQGPRADEDQYWSCFLGRETAFYPGLEKLIRLLRAPLVFIHMQRTGRGHYRLRLQHLGETAGPNDDYTMMERYIRCVETQVRAAPEDWLWAYKRWKYRRPDTAE